MNNSNPHQHMTSRERVLTALAHRQPDRAPFNLGFGLQPPAMLDFMQYMGIGGLAETEDFLLSLADMRNISPDYIGPVDMVKTDNDGTVNCIWGVKRKPVSYGAGSYDEISYYPLADATDISDLQNYPWPSADWYDFGNYKDKLIRSGRNAETGNRYAVYTGIANVFEASWYMRGFERMFMDLIDAPEFAWELMSRVTDYFIGYFTKLLQSADGMVDIVFTADDIGSQEGLLMSLPMWEKLVKPHHIRINKALHEFGVKIMYHTDGAVMDAVPSLIGMGIDILEALQFDAKGMDPATLKDCYGDRLCFHGGISVQHTLPYGSEGDVRTEVAQMLDVLGKDGGYIVAPAHAIQAGTPAANIAAFLSAATTRVIRR